MKILNDVKNAVLSVLESLFTSDTEIVSPEARRIMSNPEDRRKYIDAVEKLKSGKEERVTIELSTGKITLL